MNLNLVFKQLAVWPLILLIIGCATQGGVNQQAPTRTAAILGVTVAPGVESGRSQNAMVRELEELIQIGGRYRILRSDEANRAMNITVSGSYEAMLDNYATSGQLKGDDLRVLQAANLPVQNVLIARLEQNAVRSGGQKRIAIRNSVGQVLPDRERVVLSTVREMQIQASMVNLANGSVVWSKSYRATPAAESSYVHYSGSSFSGALAASFANTMSNGLRVPSGPVPPSNLLTVRSLLREIVRNLPR